MMEPVDLTSAFENHYEELASWARILFKEQERFFDHTKLQDALLRSQAREISEPEREGRRKHYRAVVAQEIRLKAVPACFGAPLNDDERSDEFADGMQWNRVGLYDPQAVACVLVGIETGHKIAFTGLTDSEILLALVDARIDFEGPEMDSEDDLDEKAGFDPLRPLEWLYSAPRAHMVLMPPFGDEVGMWAVWMQGIWANMLLKMLPEQDRGCAATRL
ncbi:MAG: hypothetical protein IJ113_03460 [Eggerthellaceae bacterium]|nr:hypothetical protein [Eggerthellaceae bacterium]